MFAGLTLAAEGLTQPLSAADRPFGDSPLYSRSYSAPLSGASNTLRTGRYSFGTFGDRDTGALGRTSADSLIDSRTWRYSTASDRLSGASLLDDSAVEMLLASRLRGYSRYPFDEPRMGFGYGYAPYEYPFGSALYSPRYYGYGYVLPRYYGSSFYRPYYSLSYRPYYSYYDRPDYIPAYRSLSYDWLYSRYGLYPSDGGGPYLTDSYLGYTVATRPLYSPLAFDNCGCDPCYRPYYAHCFDACGYDYGGYCCPAVPLCMVCPPPATGSGAPAQPPAVNPPPVPDEPPAANPPPTPDQPATPPQAETNDAAPVPPSAKDAAPIPQLLPPSGSSE
jgi:hypothetical protein